MMKMITQSFGLEKFSQLTKQVWVCCGLFLLFTATAFGQCPPGTSSFGGATLNGLGDINQISSCSWEASEYAPVSGANSGDELQFVLDADGDGGYITVRIGSPDGEVLGFGFSPLTVVATSSDVLYPTWNTNELCEEASTCVVTTVQCLNCSADCPELGLNIGDACDDLNEETVFDTVNDQCECVGEPIPDAPVNDVPCGALELECDVPVEGDTYFATASVLSPTCAGGSLEDVYYTISAVPGTTYTLNVNGDDFDGVLAMYIGDCDGELLEVACADNGFTTGVEEEIEFSVEEATEILVQVYNWNAEGGAYTLSLSCQVGFECPELEANIGDACDDLNDGTINDVVTEECECAGTPVPDNNDCENATLLVCGVATEGSTSTASPAEEGIEFCGTSYTGAPGVWYAYFAQADLPTTISLEGSSFDTKLFVFTGLCGELTCLGGNDDSPGIGLQSAVSFDATANTYYYVFVTGFSSSAGDYQIAVDCGYDCDELEAFIGDECDDQNEATFGDVITENCECVGTPFDCEELLANVGDACDDLDDTTENDVVNEQCECVGTPIPDAPENDLICDAILIDCGQDVEGTTINATNDEAPFCGTSNTAAGVWYNLPIDFNGTLSLLTCNQADYDTKISVFSGDDCQSELECIGGNDDGPGCSGFSSQVNLDVTAGQNLWILVHGFGSGEGNFTLSAVCTEGVDCEELGLNIGASCDDGDDSTINDTVTENCECIGEPIPANDDICDAIEVACGDIVEGTTSNATVADVASCGTSVSAPGVWYNLSVDFNGTLNASTCNNASYDTKISIFSADACDGELACVDGNDDGAGCAGFTSDLTIEVTEGQNLWILVHGFGSASGDFTLSLNCVEAFDCEELQANIGDACDDGNENTANDMINESCECVGTPVFDCPELEANIGDPCDDNNSDTENDMINDNCGCEGTPIVVPGDCQDWAMFINDNEGGETDIYAVDMVGGNAELTFLTTLDFHAHMAYNPADNLLYVVNNSTGYYVTVNPHVSPVEVSAPVVLSEDIPSVTTAEFSPIGKLLIGSSTQDIIYSVDINDASVSVFDSYAPISGGDIAFDEAGALYLGTRSGNGLYQVFPDDLMDDQFIGNIPNLVTGMALAEGGQQLITSHNGNADLIATNLDGSPAGSYALMLDGEAFDHNNGDLAAGCNTFQDENEGDCEAFSTYYAHFGNGTGVSGADIYSVSFSGNEAVMSFLTNVNFGAHIAYDAQSDIIYLVNPNGSFVRAYDPTAGIFLGDLPIVGDINQLFAVVFNPADGLLYVGDANDDEIYSIDLGSGVATFVADAPVSGGDLAIQDGVLYLANRGNAELYEVSGGSATLVADIPEANGMAQANNATDLVVAQPGSTEFVQFSAADGSLVASYTATIDGNPVTLQDGDMAAGCGDDEEVVVPGGECNATEVIEYVEGTTTNGGSLAANRVDASQALGAPERADELVFVTLGYDGSITLAFDGAVPNGEGDDIEVVETSYGNPGCEAYPEYADVSVSMDGINWFSAGTVCKSEPFVDISDAGDFEYVMYVRISNITELTTSGDGFDLDGVVALHNCEEEVENGDENPALTATSASTLTSYPNPTAGPSQVVFTTATSGTTLVEVYDMNGRSVATLFNQVTQEGQEYRVDFDGTDLPNGIYVYRLTTNGETIVDKFMVTK